MPNPFFQFKQFTVWHDKCAMKVGTDGVLLGAWAPVETASTILDIGTGTGLVALMLAQRSQASIIGIEIDKAASEQAKENVKRSPWQDRIEIVLQDFKNYHHPKKFDAIVSNPPYFEDSLKCPDAQRSSARHDSDLTYDDLFSGVSKHLSEKGSFTLVAPADVADKLIHIAFQYKMYPCKQLYIITKPGGKAKRSLISFCFSNHPCQTETLLTEIARHQYSEEYTELTRKFYLNM